MFDQSVTKTDKPMTMLLNSNDVVILDIPICLAILKILQHTIFSMCGDTSGIMVFLNCCNHSMDHSPFKLNLHFCKKIKMNFGEFRSFCGKRNTKVYKICKLRKRIFSVFYNISPPNLVILLILTCSF